MKRIFWMHSDCLRPVEGDAVFIFDPAQVEHEQWSLKRLVFLFESVPEEVTILKGDTVTLLSRFDEVVTEDTPDPWLRKRITQLLPLVTLLPAPGFAGLRTFQEADLKRFTRYWKKAESKVLG